MIISNKTIVSAAVSLLLILYSLYTAYSYGVSSTERTYKEKESAEIIKLQGTIQGLQVVIGKLSSDLVLSNTSMASDISAMYSKLSGLPITVIRNGKCTMSDDFVQARQQALDRIEGKQ